MLITPSQCCIGSGKKRPEENINVSLFIFTQIMASEIIRGASSNWPLVTRRCRRVGAAGSCSCAQSAEEQSQSGAGNPAPALTAIVCDKDGILAAARGKMQFQGGWCKLLIIPDLIPTRQPNESELPATKQLVTGGRATVEILYAEKLVTPHYSFICALLPLSLAEDIAFLVSLQEYQGTHCRTAVSFRTLSKHTPLCTDPSAKVGQGYSIETTSKSQRQKEQDTRASFRLKFLC